jgi:hypothetical protein
LKSDWGLIFKELKLTLDTVGLCPEPVQNNSYLKFVIFIRPPFDLPSRISLFHSEGGTREQESGEACIMRSFIICKGEAIPVGLQVWTNPELSWRLRLPNFKAIG